MANGLDERRALEHAARVRALNGRFENLTLLAGIECDILADGRLDLSDDCLAQLDIVVASIHSHFSQDSQQMTDRSAARHRVSMGRRARASDRPPAAQARPSQIRHDGGAGFRVPARSRAGDQLPGRSTRPERFARARRARTRHPARDLHRRAQRQRAVTSSVGRAGRASRLGAGRRRHQHTPGRRDARPASAKSERHDVAKTPDGFVSLKSLKQGPPSPRDTLALIRRIYFKTTRQTIEHDFAHAIELLKEPRDGRGARKGDRLHARPLGAAEGMDAARKRRSRSERSQVR